MRLSKEMQAKPDLRLELIDFNILDNNLIDSVYSNIMTIRQDKLGHAGDDLLVEEELLFHVRKITKELEFIAELPFVQFWVYMVKVPVFINFLDTFLQNIRKYNDYEKVQIDLDQSYNMENSKLSSSGADVQQ